MVNAPRFWWGKTYGILGMLSLLIAFVYGKIAGARMQKEPTNVADVPVICIGNFVVGGAGKTPFCIMLFEILKSNGFTPVFLTRGYGGNQTEPLQVESRTHTAKLVGDEAILLAKVGATIVAKDRGKGAELATKIGGDIIIMDDGFQNPSLKKDASIVLVDSDVGVGNGRCIPAGPLRAPLDVQVNKTDILVVVGSGESAEEVIQIANRYGKKPFYTEFKPTNSKQFNETPILAYAGIGHPQKFFDTLKNENLNVIHEIGFPDHHNYKNGEMKNLLTIAEQESLTLVTTAKDQARLAGIDGDTAAELLKKSQVLEVEMELKDTNALVSQVMKLLDAKSD